MLTNATSDPLALLMPSPALPPSLAMAAGATASEFAPTLAALLTSASMPIMPGDASATAAASGKPVPPTGEILPVAVIQDAAVLLPDAPRVAEDGLFAADKPGQQDEADPAEEPALAWLLPPPVAPMPTAPFAPPVAPAPLPTDRAGDRGPLSVVPAEPGRPSAPAAAAASTDAKGVVRSIDPAPAPIAPPGVMPAPASDVAAPPPPVAPPPPPVAPAPTTGVSAPATPLSAPPPTGTQAPVPVPATSPRAAVPPVPMPAPELRAVVRTAGSPAATPSAATPPITTAASLVAERAASIPPSAAEPVVAASSAGARDDAPSQPLPAHQAVQHAGTAAPVAATGGGQQAGIDLTRDPGLHRMIDRIEQLRDAANAADTRIRLIPDALGPVDVSVTRDGDAVQVRFTAQQDATRQLIADAAPRLTELAEARGVRIDRTSVDGGGAQHWGDQSRQPGWAQPGQPGRPAPAARQAADAEQPTDQRIA